MVLSLHTEDNGIQNEKPTLYIGLQSLVTLTLKNANLDKEYLKDKESFIVVGKFPGDNEYNVEPVLNTQPSNDLNYEFNVLLNGFVDPCAAHISIVKIVSRSH